MQIDLGTVNKVKALLTAHVGLAYLFCYQWRRRLKCVMHGTRENKVDKRSKQNTLEVWQKSHCKSVGVFET